MIIYNSSKNTLIADDVKVAKNFITRSIGLLSKKDLKTNEALIIKPCSAVHTFFMKFNIDVLYIDKNNKVLSVFENVSSSKILPINFRCAYVIELKAQNIKNKISINDIIELKN